MAEQTVNDPILALLAKEPRLTLSKLAERLARNPGGIRHRLLRMAATGRVISEGGPKGWVVYSVPPGAGRRRLVRLSAGALLSSERARWAFGGPVPERLVAYV